MTMPPSLIRAALRALWLRSPMRNECAKRARIHGTGYSRCESCADHVRGSEIEIDHVVPVGETPGMGLSDTTWDGFIARLFCDAEGLRALCSPCHKARTKAQRAKGKTP